MSDPVFPEPPAELERAARSRLAAQTRALLLPTLERAKVEALRRAYRVLDLGGMLKAEDALAVVLELYAIDKLDRAMRREERKPAAATPDVQDDASRS